MNESFEKNKDECENNISFQIAENKKTKKFIKIALDNKLYMRSGLLKRYLEMGLKTRRDAIYLGRQRYAAGLAYVYGNPVAVVYISGVFLSVYVKKEYRGKGIGFNLTSLLLKRYPFQETILVGVSTVKGSKELWNKFHFVPYTINDLTKRIVKITERHRNSIADKLTI